MILKELFGFDSTESAVVPDALSGTDKQTLVDILCDAATMMPFTAAEAKTAVAYMLLRSFREGEVIIAEGSRTNLDYMLWVLEGEATFEAFAGSGAGRSVTVTVLGAGSALGTMSMVDGEPRSLQGIASMPTRCAMLTRSQLKKLCRDHPQVGIKLMAVLCLIFSQTLRNLTTKFKCHVRLNNALNAELMGKDAASFEFEDAL